MLPLSYIPIPGWTLFHCGGLNTTDPVNSSGVALLGGVALLRKCVTVGMGIEASFAQCGAQLSEDHDAELSASSPAP